ncbi:MAG TPA: group 1 truncated hemoglobin [Pyrinomonadaceae bacterium]|nr:group 1 truncated hemoglobin [Pyrinomonadaceae bacterium]
MHSPLSTFGKAISVLALSALLVTGAGLMGTAQEKTGKSLYDRIGGYNALAAVVDDFIGRLVADSRFAKFFAGHSDDSKKRIRQHIVDQFCAATGGPCIYTGREMRTSHQGLAITEADWDAAAKLLVASLDKFKVPAKEKDEVMTFVSGLKKDIVEK